MTNLFTPWTLHFDRDGTEDIAIIRDAHGHELVTSRHFWLPESDDPVPPTLAAMRMMVAAPKLLDALQTAEQEIMGMLEDLCDEPEEDISTRRTLATIRSAIAETEGNG